MRGVRYAAGNLRDALSPRDGVAAGGGQEVGVRSGDLRKDIVTPKERNEDGGERISPGRKNYSLL